MSKVLSRRSVLHFGIGVSLGVNASFRSKGDAGVSWEALMSELVLVTKSAHETLLQTRIERALRNLDRNQVYVRSMIAQADVRGLHPDVRQVAARDAFEVRLVTLHPNDTIPLHDHLGLLGVAICLEGRVRHARG